MPEISTKASAASEKPKFLVVNDSSGLPGTWFMKMVIRATALMTSIRVSRTLLFQLFMPVNRRALIWFRLNNFVAVGANLE